MVGLVRSRCQAAEMCDVAPGSRIGMYLTPRHPILRTEAGTIDTRPWITHHAGFGEMIEAFPGWLKPETGVIKAIVEVPDA